MTFFRDNARTLEHFDSIYSFLTSVLLLSWILISHIFETSQEIIIIVLHGQYQFEFIYIFVIFTALHCFLHFQPSIWNHFPFDWATFSVWLTWWQIFSFFVCLKMSLFDLHSFWIKFLEWKISNKWKSRDTCIMNLCIHHWTSKLSAPTQLVSLHPSPCSLRLFLNK